MQGGKRGKHGSPAHTLPQFTGPPSDERNYVYAWHHVCCNQHCQVWLFLRLFKKNKGQALSILLVRHLIWFGMEIREKIINSVEIQINFAEIETHTATLSPWYHYTFTNEFGKKCNNFWIHILLLFYNHETSSCFAKCSQTPYWHFYSYAYTTRSIRICLWIDHCLG